MDTVYLLRFFHFIGFIFLGGGLLAVFISEWRGYSATRPVILAEAAFYTAIFYDFMAVPDALLMLITGPLLMWELGYNYFDTPWLTAMWSLFLFEFIEGNTLTRVQFRRTLRVSRAMPEDQPLTEETRREARTFVGRLTHFLDLPLFSVIIYCGVARPDSWLDIGRAIGIAIVMALALMYIVPWLAERSGALPPKVSA